MMPKSVRGLLKVRRTCRKKIHERITAVSGECFFLIDDYSLFDMEGLYLLLYLYSNVRCVAKSRD